MLSITCKMVKSLMTSNFELKFPSELVTSIDLTSQFFSFINLCV